MFLPLFSAQMKPVKTPPKSHARGVVFEEVFTVDLEEDEVISEPKTKISLPPNSTCVHIKITNNSLFFFFFFYLSLHIFSCSSAAYITALLFFLCSKPAEQAYQTIVLDDTDDEDNELNEKTNRLMELFPQLTRPDALEVSVGKIEIMYLNTSE